MKIFVKTLKGSTFDIEVKPEDTVADVKKNIETAQGVAVYPAQQQMLIHQAKVLKDNTTLDENKIVENSFVVIMLSKTKSSSSDGSTVPTAPTTKVTTLQLLFVMLLQLVPNSLKYEGLNSSIAAVKSPCQFIYKVATGTLAPTTSTPASTTAPQAPTLTYAPPASAPAPAPALFGIICQIRSDYVYGQAASSLVAGNNLEVAVQQILDMGGGTWDRDTVVRALRAAYNNPERAIEYLYSGIPEQAEVPPVAQIPIGGQAPAAQPQQHPTQTAAVPSGGPNANPLDLFPQGLPNMGSGAGGAGTLDFLRNSQQVSLSPLYLFLTDA
ncbi:hypothetical protein NC653_021069 [Populus alba x Populus x berolinensis]|uniref:Uncharacterized protein n=1 Tax=Populus alba x Populus x berolinensis TaxID=444605 RepID=A0AAD6MM02_9ROSI|nr:hypothetical protein NC653_021069 [Populus alba x Populus x berolinensis]